MKFSIVLWVFFSLSLAHASHSSQLEVNFEHYSEELDEREVAELSHEIELQRLQSFGHEAMSGADSLIGKAASGLGLGSRVLSQGLGMAALGVDIYKLVEAGRPSINTNFAPIHVLPVEGGNYVHPMRLTEVSGYQGRRYTFVGRSLVGLEVIRFTYTLMFQTGKHRRGRYIMNAFVKADTWVLWSNSFDASMQFVGMANAGTPTAPVAQASLKVRYKAGSILVARETEVVLQLDARGRIARFE
jgi:hypothetical protein